MGLVKDFCLIVDSGVGDEREKDKNVFCVKRNYWWIYKICLVELFFFFLRKYENDFLILDIDGYLKR